MHPMQFTYGLIVNCRRLGRRRAIWWILMTLTKTTTRIKLSVLMPTFAMHQQHMETRSVLKNRRPSKLYQDMGTFRWCASRSVTVSKCR